MTETHIGGPSLFPLSAIRPASIISCHSRQSLGLCEKAKIGKWWRFNWKVVSFGFDSIKIYSIGRAAGCGARTMDDRRVKSRQLLLSFGHKRFRERGFDYFSLFSTCVDGPAAPTCFGIRKTINCRSLAEDIYGDSRRAFFGLPICLPPGTSSGMLFQLRHMEGYGTGRRIGRKCFIFFVVCSVRIGWRTEAKWINKYFRTFNFRLISFPLGSGVRRNTMPFTW